MSYVEGFLLPVPTAKRETYRELALTAAAIYKKHGALRIAEGWGDDVPDGKLTSFPMAVKRQDDEAVVFAWIMWPSREERDAGNKKVMSDPRMQPDAWPMPVDGKRMIFGGFDPILDVGLNTAVGEYVHYIDGFVAAVPTAKREDYRQHAATAAAVFKAHGALKIVECWGDDVPDGKLTSFPMAVKKQADETVVFSWIVWPSKAVRNAGMKAVMADPRMQPDVLPMPFDGKRLIYGGFETIVDV